MRLILFDLDGTLLKAGGIGRKSTRKALEEVFGTSGNLDAFYPGGRTQEAIFLDTLLDAGIDLQSYQSSRDKLYQVFLAEFKKIARENGDRIQPLPGAIDLIQMLKVRKDLVLGVVTGNHKNNAALKLEGAGFDLGWIKTGAYGEESANRLDLVALAKSRAETETGFDFSGKKTIVVGDTARDVASARQADALSIAVSTGTDGRDQLEAAAPDLILKGLENPRPVLDILAEGNNL